MGGPYERGRVLLVLLNRISAAQQGAFLAVLKLFGPPGERLVSFPMEGCMLAYDLPLCTGTPALLAASDEVTHWHGGHVSLAKDACTTPARMRKGYLQCDTFSTILSESADPLSRFASALPRRLTL